MRQLKFPPYEYIKSLPRDTGEFYNEYNWTLFTTPTNDKGAISYNLTGEGFVYFDVFEDGYSDMNCLGLALKFNKANYAKICKHAQKVFEDFYRELDKDYSWQWEKYEEEER